jgi:hypothetical protein
LGTVISESFVATPDATQSAVDLTKIEHVAEKIDAFATELIAEGGLGNSDIEDAFDNTLYFDDYDYIDIYHFAQNVSEAKVNASTLQAAQALMDALDDAIIWHGHGLSSYSDEHGLSIYFPDEDYSSWDPAYLDLAFAADTAWDDLVKF